MINMKISVVCNAVLLFCGTLVSGQFGNIPGNGGFVSVGQQLPLDPLDPWASVGFTYPSIPGQNPGPNPDPGLFPQYPQNPLDPANRGNPHPNPKPNKPAHPAWTPGGAGFPGNNPNSGRGTVVITPQKPNNPTNPRKPPRRRPQTPKPRPRPRPRPTPRKPKLETSKPNQPPTPRVVPGNEGPVVVEPVAPNVTPKKPFNPFDGDQTPFGGTASGPFMTCADNPCQNRGVCMADSVEGYRCECRHLYLGERCEVIISPPQHISIDEVAPSRASISWRVPPSINEEIEGFVVQFNKFGYENYHYSPFIHPSVADFTLTDLDPDSQYTVCVSIILINMTQTDAVLRDQCVEIRTKPLSLNDTGLPVTMVAIILGGVVVALILIMLLALCCQRKCLNTRRAVIGAAATVRRVGRPQTCEIHGNQKAKVTARVSGNNSPPKSPPKKEHAYSKPGPPVKERALPRITSPNRVTPSPRSQQTQPLIPKAVKPQQHACKPDITAAHIAKRCVHANNANNAGSASSTGVFSIDIPPIIPEHDIAMKAIKSAAKKPTDPAMQASYYARSYSVSSSEYTEHGAYGGRLLSLYSETASKTTTHPPSVIRALPKSVSNHMMRIKNARDKDATSDFDMARTYFLPRK